MRKFIVSIVALAMIFTSMVVVPFTPAKADTTVGYTIDATTLTVGSNSYALGTVKTDAIRANELPGGAAGNTVTVVFTATIPTAPSSTLTFTATTYLKGKKSDGSYYDYSPQTFSFEILPGETATTVTLTFANVDTRIGSAPRDLSAEFLKNLEVVVDATATGYVLSIDKEIWKQYTVTIGGFASQYKQGQNVELQGSVKDASGNSLNGRLQIFVEGSIYDPNGATHWKKASTDVTSGLYVIPDFEFKWVSNYVVVYGEDDTKIGDGLYSVGAQTVAYAKAEFVDMPATLEQGDSFVFKMKLYAEEHPYCYPTGSNGAISIKFYNENSSVIGTVSVEPTAVYDSEAGGNIGYYATVLSIPAGAVSMGVFYPTAASGQASCGDFVYYGLPIKTFDIAPKAATYTFDKDVVPGYYGITDASLLTDQVINITVKDKNNSGISGTLYYKRYFYDNGALLAADGSYQTAAISSGASSITIDKTILQNLGSGNDYIVIKAYAKDTSGYVYQSTTYQVPVRVIKGAEVSISNMPNSVGTTTVTIKVIKKDGMLSGNIKLYYALVSGPKGTTIDNNAVVPSDKTTQSDIIAWLKDNVTPVTTSSVAEFTKNVTVFVPAGGKVKVVAYAEVTDSNENSSAYQEAESEVNGYTVEGAQSVVYGDPVTIKLKVKDENGVVVNNAKVVLYTKDGSKIVPDVFAKKDSSFVDQTELTIDGGIVNVIGGEYDFNAVYGAKVDFTAGKATTIYAKVYDSAGTLRALDVPVVVINPKEDLSVSVTGDIVPGEESNFTVSVSGIPSSSTWKLTILNGYYYEKYGIEVPVSGLPAPTGLTSSSYEYVAVLMSFGTYYVKVETEDGNHYGITKFEVKAADVAISPAKAKYTYGMKYDIAGKVTFNGEAYNDASYEVYVYDLDTGDFVDLAAGTMVGNEFSLEDVAIPADTDYELLVIDIIKNGKYVAEQYYPLGNPVVQVKDKDGQYQEASSDVIIGYVGQNIPVDIKVTEADGTAIAGANVSIKLGGGTLATGLTNEDGEFTAVIKPNSVSILTIEITKDTLAIEKKVSVAMDSEPPVITITEPSDITQTIQTMDDKIRIAGTVEDNVGVDKIVVIVNGVPVKTVVPVAGFFATTVDLSSGLNTIVIRAYDVNDNMAESNVIKVEYTEPVDEEAPVIEITSPVIPEGMLVYETDKASIVVKGTVEDEGTGVKAVYVNTEPVDLIGNTFAKEVKLAEGANTIVVKAIDYAGNVAQKQITVVYDPYLGKIVIELSPGSQFYKINGETKVMDVAPFINEAGRTMVPVRFIAEAMGLSVKWDGEKRQVTITGEDKEVVLTIDSCIAVVDGTPVKMDTKAVIVNGRTFVPLRFVAEAFGFDVQWNPPVITLVKEK